MFFNFELHLRCDRDGDMVAVDLLTGISLDGSALKAVILDNVNPIVLDDSGYVSGPAAQELGSL